MASSLFPTSPSSLFPPSPLSKLRSRSPMASVVELEAQSTGFQIPAPSHRHGTPSGPWPFLDPGDQLTAEQLNASGPIVPPNSCNHSDSERCKSCWKNYPQSLFPNWTPTQQERSLISFVINRSLPCTIRYADVDLIGNFSAGSQLEITRENQDAHWNFMRELRPADTRLRAIFLDNLSGPVLQMVGTKYHIEPFFWSSSLGWIPSRFQDSVVPKTGDHLTIVLKFVRSVKRDVTNSLSNLLANVELARDGRSIDIQTPLFLSSRDQALVFDLLALHMVRDCSNSTIISYHSSQNHRTTPASLLHERLVATGRSVYWNKIFSQHGDPTFVFLSLFWFALYAWDEALEHLYLHICFLELKVMQIDRSTDLTNELHLIRGHLHHYLSLLADFEKSIKFILNTSNPTLDNYSPHEQEQSQEVLRRECNHLLNEIGRLERFRLMQDERVQNVMDLGYHSVNMYDSIETRKLTEASLRDSSDTKVVSYLTMFFLPAGLIASVFGMNVVEINTNVNGHLYSYFAIAVPLTLATMLAFRALQHYSERKAKAKERNRGASVFRARQESRFLRRVEPNILINHASHI